MPNTLQYMLQGFLFLAILVAMILAAYVALKFINKKMTVSSNQTLEIISGLALSQSKGIYIVRILDSYYVVGLGDDVRLLREITDEAEVETLININETSPSNVGIKGEDFTKILSEHLSKISKGNKGEHRK